MSYDATVRDEIFQRLGVYVNWWYQLDQTKTALEDRLDEAVCDFNIRNVGGASDTPSDADMKAFETLSAEIHRQQQALDSLRSSVTAAVTDFLTLNVKDLLGSPDGSAQEVLDDLIHLMGNSGDSVPRNTVDVTTVEEGANNSVLHTTDNLTLPAMSDPPAQLARGDSFSLVCSDASTAGAEQWTLQSSLNGRYSGQILTGTAADWAAAGISNLLISEAPAHGKQDASGKVSGWAIEGAVKGANVSADGRVWAKFNAAPSLADDEEGVHQLSGWSLSGAAFGTESDVDGQIHVSVVKDPPEATATHNTAVLSGISVTGDLDTYTDAGTLYAGVTKSGSTYTVDLYSNNTRTTLVAHTSGTDLGEPMTLISDSPSDLSGEVTLESYAGDDSTIQIRLPGYCVRLYRSSSRAAGDLVSEGISLEPTHSSLALNSAGIGAQTAGTVDLNYFTDDETITLTPGFCTVDLYRADPSAAGTTSSDVSARAGSRSNLLTGAATGLEFFAVNGSGLTGTLDLAAVNVGSTHPSAVLGYAQGDMFTFRTTSDDAGRFQTFLREAFNTVFPSAVSGQETISDALAMDGGGSPFSGPIVVVTSAGPRTPVDGATYVNDGASVKVGFTTANTANTGLANAFIVTDADGIRITACAGHTIRMAGGDVTKAGGYIESTTIGSGVSLLKTGATSWLAVTWYGNWTVEVS